MAATIADNPFSTFHYFDRPDRVWIHRYTDDGAVMVNFLHVDTNTGRVTWAQNWAQVWDLVQAGVCREVCYGPATYNDGAFFLA